MDATAKFFSYSKYAILWNAIAENRLAYAKQLLAPHFNQARKSLFSFLYKNKWQHYETSFSLAMQICSGEPLQKIVLPNYSIQDSDVQRFINLVYLLVALNKNEHLESSTLLLEQAIVPSLSDLSTKIKAAAGNYPATTIQGYVWANGSTIRDWAAELANYFKEKDQAVTRLNVLQSKGRITGCIMGHYPYVIGPDMLETAAAMEELGHTEEASAHYKAIIKDFQPYADDIYANPDEPVWEDIITTLSCLRSAYEKQDRITPRESYQQAIQDLTRVIDIGVTEKEETEDNED